MMLNTFASYKKFLYAIKNTPYENTTTSSVNFQKFTILKDKVFESTRKF